MYRLEKMSLGWQFVLRVVCQCLPKCHRANMTPSSQPRSVRCVRPPSRARRRLCPRQPRCRPTREALAIFHFAITRHGRRASYAILTLSIQFLSMEARVDPSQAFSMCVCVCVSICLVSKDMCVDVPRGADSWHWLRCPAQAPFASPGARSTSTRSVLRCSRFWRAAERTRAPTARAAWPPQSGHFYNAYPYFLLLEACSHARPRSPCIAWIVHSALSQQWRVVSAH